MILLYMRRINWCMLYTRNWY